MTILALWNHGMFVGMAEHATGRIIAVTGSRRLTLPPRARSEAPARRQPGPPAGSPVRLHRYDFEFTTAAGAAQYGFSFAGGGLYALGDKADVSYDATNPELCRAAGTHLDPSPWAAAIAIFPAFGLIVLAHMFWRNRRAAKPGVSLP